MFAVKNFLQYPYFQCVSFLNNLIEKDDFCILHFNDSITLNYKNNDIQVPPHSIIIYTPDNTKIAFKKFDSSCDIIHFQGDIKSYVSSFGLHTDTIYTLQEIEFIERIFNEIKIEFYNSRPYYSKIINIHLEELLLKILRDYSAETIIGYNAKKTLYTFDFSNIWSTTESYPMLRKFINEANNVSPIWDGTIESPDVSSKGDSIDNPILINNAKQLAWLVKNGQKYCYYKFTNDIYLNDIDKIDWYTGEIVDPSYKPNEWYLGYESCAISGNIDGDGHIVYGLYYNTSKEETGYNETSHIGAGLFPAISNINIYNIGIKNSFLKHYDNYSLGSFFGLAHYIGNGSINYCFVDSTVTLIGNDVGGIAGGGDLNKKKIIIQNCFSLAKIIGTRYVGAFIGNSWTTNEWFIKDSYCVGKPYGSTWKFPEVENVFSTEQSSGNLSYLVGDLSFRNFNKETLVKFRAIRNKVFATLNEKWTIERMAKEVNFSQSRFCNIYKEIFGVSPIADIINERINSAKNMLSYGKMSIAEISYSLGYENITHFSRQFKANTGFSPIAYRQIHL